MGEGLFRFEEHDRVWGAIEKEFWLIYGTRKLLEDEGASGKESETNWNVSTRKENDFRSEKPVGSGTLFNRTGEDNYDN